MKRHSPHKSVDKLSRKEKVLRTIAIVIAFASTYFFLVKLVIL